MKCLLQLLIALVLYPRGAAPEAPLLALLAAERTEVSPTLEERDGQHDFDFSLGTWRTEVSLLRNPLSGSDSWVDYEGTSVVHALWGGRANLVELDVEGPAGRIEGLNLRLYDPETRQWSLHYANSRNGAMGPPVTGAFRDERGEFIGRETLDGRDILVKFVISNMTPDSWRYEQSFSDDGGETWEVNWIAIDTVITRKDD